MVGATGDAPTTAAIVAQAVGLDGATCPPGKLPDDLKPETFAVYADVLPEDKYKLVKAFQKAIIYLTNTALGLVWASRRALYVRRSASASLHR